VLLCTGLLVITGHTASVEETVNARTRELVETETKFQGLFEFAPDGIVLVNQYGLLIRVNAQAEQLFGYRREELIGQSIEILLPERFRGKHAGHRNHFMAEPHRRPMGA